MSASLGSASRPGSGGDDGSIWHFRPVGSEQLENSSQLAPERQVRSDESHGLVASTMGSLASTLSQPKTEEEHDKLTVELGVTVEGQAVLEAR